jgi:cob(I)alamin adenosyltransferase
MMDGGDEGRGESKVIVFTGEGESKTTAALGIALRTVTGGGKVVYVHFTGPRHPVLGEVKTAAAVGSKWRMVGIRNEAEDISYLDDFAESVATAGDALSKARTLWLRECDLLVLDDIAHHLTHGSIDVAQVLALIDDKPPNTIVVLTGLSFPESIMQRADMVTEFTDAKRPAQTDICLRKGIDF